MVNYLKNLKWEMVLFSVSSIVVGILMWKYPNKIITAMCIILAAILVLMGIRYLIEYKRKVYMGSFYRYELVTGILLLIGAVVVLACMKTILSIITYVIAVIIIVSALMKLENAIDLKRMDCHWQTLMIFSILCILLGISVLMMPMNDNDNGTRTAGDFMIQSAGVVFAVTGLIDLITTLSVSGKIKRWIRDNEDVEVKVDEDDIEILDE